MAELLLIAKLAGERVAFPADEVESVVEIGELVRVPRAAAHVAGLSALRSRVLTVIDCRAALGLDPVSGPTGGDAVVCLVGGHAYALLVDAVEDVVSASKDTAPVRTALSPGWSRVARGMAEAEGELLLLVDPQTLVTGCSAEAA